jgi:hypothetical protein
MNEELLGDGHAVNFVVLHGASASSAANQGHMTDAVDFPVFQDTAAVNAWALHEGAKDDIYIYGAEGTLSTYLPYPGAISTSLSSAAGYANVKNAILDALGE